MTQQHQNNLLTTFSRLAALALTTLALTTLTPTPSLASPTPPNTPTSKTTQHDPLASLPTNPLQGIMDALRRWRPDEAVKQLTPLLARSPKNQRLLFLLGQARYFQGRYKEALKIYEKAASPDILKKQGYYISLKATLEVTGKYHFIQSPHFQIHYAQGKDRILLTYAIQALEKAYDRLGKVFGYRSPTRVRVDILQDSMELAKVSPLTDDDIMRTGTIALCKYNRIMLTTPRALLRGYRWIDTLIHEYTHLLINRSAQGVPIWLHEGLARYGETLWRQNVPAPLSPYSESILAQALKKDKLITFSQMHPSMAKLPSQKDAALAYAQVYTVVKYFAKRAGHNSITKLLTLIQRGHSIPKAFSLILHTPFESFLKQWKIYMRKQKLRVFAGLMPTKKILKNQPNSPKNKELEKRNFWYRPSSPKALGARYLRLGEMLRRRGRKQAALLEYKKAEKHWKNLNPRLQNKIALTLFSMRKYQPAIPHLQDSLKLYPSHFTTQYHLGRAYFGLKKYQTAKKYFDISNQINPFHPGIHRYLIAIYRLLGDNTSLKREIRILQKLRQPDD